ncbi:Transcription initiation factor tfiid subunit [Thalictrum thalictroides]|uniref:Transcription initiation factor tfiid subunit n=1 Tax=Thalictrum thalictroides TaxID=46969 RepID=A0A7J6WL38_THATH|nr:Transcription initiation factor tfiid subunit [Thalictrum thalictroides]
MVERDTRMDTVSLGHGRIVHWIRTRYVCFIQYSSIVLWILWQRGIAKKEMEFAHYLGQSKVNIKICQYSYELLLQYLHKTQSITMLGIINEHINFQVSPGQPSSISDDADAVILVGSSQDTAKQINEKEIHWGVSL